jgi:hypothetical protein
MTRLTQLAAMCRAGTVTPEVLDEIADALDGRVKIKPMDWSPICSDCIRAETRCEIYVITFGWHNGKVSLNSQSGVAGFTWHKTIKSAKAAAQADYEARILAAIEVTE